MFDARKSDALASAQCPASPKPAQNPIDLINSIDGIDWINTSFFQK